MTVERRPWWFSGDDVPESEQTPEREPAPEPERAPEPEPDSGPQGAGSLDWTALVLGAQRLVDWATSTVMAPHADHGDPREHPQCVVCRAMLLLADRPAPTAADPAAEASDAGDGQPGEIAWIPVLEESPGA